MQIADSILDLVGNTPLVRMPKFTAHLSCDFVIKLELTNPGGSSKDRLAVAMIDAADPAGSVFRVARRSRRYRFDAI